MAAGLAPDPMPRVNGAIHLFDPETGERLWFCWPGAGRVNSVAFSPDGSVLAAAFDTGSIMLWQVDRGEKLRQLTGHTGNVHQVRFSPDGIRLASVSGHGTYVRKEDDPTEDVENDPTIIDFSVRVWDWKAGVEVWRYEHPDEYPFEAVAYSPDGSRLAIVDNLRDRNSYCVGFRDRPSVFVVCPSNLCRESAVVSRWPISVLGSAYSTESPPTIWVADPANGEVSRNRLVIPI